MHTAFSTCVPVRVYRPTDCHEGAVAPNPSAIPRVSTSTSLVPQPSGERLSELPRRRRLSPLASAGGKSSATTAAEKVLASKPSTPGLGTVVVLGLSHNTAGVEVRECLAVPEAEWQSAAAGLAALDSVAEAAIMSTCNRFEVYIIAEHGFRAITAVVNHLSARSSIPAHELRRHLFMLTGNEATWHLLRVSAGLDSLVIGEGQILSQVKRCYELATEKAGHAGKVLSRLLNTAVSAGKRVRSETGISKGAVSISSAAVELAEMRSVADTDLPISEARICILGAGKMSRLLVQHLVSRSVADITIVNRSLGRAEELANMFPDVTLNLVLMHKMLDAVAQADIVFASTAATEPILTRDIMSGVLLPGQRCMLVDISVPRNVAADVAEIRGVLPYNVDDLKAVVAKNQARRRKLMLEAEQLLREEQTGFNNWHHSLGCVPAISKLQQRAEAIRQEELERMKGKLTGLSNSERKAVETLSRGIINKMLHSPMVHLRELEDMEERTQTLEAIEALFRL